MKVLDKYEIKEGLYYTKEHEWVKIQDNGILLVGITDFAQQELGDVAFVDLPEEGEEAKQGQVLFQIESVKAVADVFSPVSGHVIEINTKLEDSPEIINSDPYGKGWLVKIKATNLEEDKKNLMTPEEYKEFIIKTKEN